MDNAKLRRIRHELGHYAVCCELGLGIHVTNLVVRTNGEAFLQFRLKQITVSGREDAVKWTAIALAGSTVDGTVEKLKTEILDLFVRDKSPYSADANSALHAIGLYLQTNYVEFSNATKLSGGQLVEGQFENISTKMQVNLDDGRCKEVSNDVAGILEEAENLAKEVIGGNRVLIDKAAAIISERRANKIKLTRNQLHRLFVKCKRR